MRYTREDGCRAWLTYGQLNYDSLHRLMTDFGCAEAVYDHFRASDGAELADYAGSDQLALLRQAATPEAMHEMMVLMRKGEMGVVSLSDALYPEALRNIADPPLILFYHGELECLMGRCVTMVGARRASPDGERAAFQVAKELGAAGVTVVSGMASGIDTAAHEGCLEGGGITAAVLACGLDVDYPADNSALKQRLVRSGGVMLSEYPPRTPALSWHFPVRNRIISGLSRAVVMMECRVRSGTMRTIQHALDQGREVYAYPGKVGTAWAEGAHQLLREGANYFATAQDILLDMGWAEATPPPTRQEKQALPPLSEEQRRVLKELTQGECSFDQLAAATGMDAPQLSSALTMLQLLGLIRSLPGKTYARI